MKCNRGKKNVVENYGMHGGAERELFDFAFELRRKMTEAEKVVWNFLRTKPKGYKFRRQHPFGRYILDFYCHAKKLCVEIDGPYHETTEQQEKDKVRTEVLVEMGITELRFTNEEVLGDLEMVKAQICAFLEEE